MVEVIRTVTGPKRMPPQTFTMIRHADESGVSGTGPVLTGVVFPSGATVIEWLSPIDSITVFPSFAAFQRIHIDSHPTNRTEILWDSEARR